MGHTRRSFLKHTAASAVAAPFVLNPRVWAADVKPSERVGMGFIGMGKQNGGLLGGFLGLNTQVLAVCEVDKTRREHAQKRVIDHYKGKKVENPKCDAYVDFRELLARKDIDAVCIATPDHWHAIITVAALKVGKDVYCEKPLTHNIHEAIEVIKAVDANNRVLQTGSMQRSSMEFRVACELVLNGAIGKISRVECQFGDPGVPCNLPEEKMEEGLDWDMWQGPAPVRPYNSVLSPRGVHNHFPHWRNYREYGGGMVTDWGAHYLDIAQWGLGMDGSGPVQALPPAKQGDKRGAKLVYANGVEVIHSNGFGVHFFGSEGEVKVNRGRFEMILGGKVVASSVEKGRKSSCAAEVTKAQRAYLKDPKIQLYVSKNHLWDFMDCVKSRKKPITSEQVGGRSAICCHLMNQAYYNQKTIKWDPAKLCFADSASDPKWLTRDYRKPWSV
ncbi:MAG TPA: Gfo/Idh/MocA family oxidoreductase [Phycisphaerae bacterium]|nr:Gfo/Idh/MocA family oxidoreductase [Phycisphaerae bacterium]